MILCPTCKHQELTGALFCSECGARLVVSEVPTTNSIEGNQTGLLVSAPVQHSTRPTTQSPTGPISERTLSLHLIEHYRFNGNKTWLEHSALPIPKS